MNRRVIAESAAPRIIGAAALLTLGFIQLGLLGALAGVLVALIWIATEPKEE